MTNLKKKLKNESKANNTIVRDDAPIGHDPELRDRIKSFANEHNFVISEYVEHKIKWSEEHESRCFCDAFHRKCPCDYIYEDMVKFNGRCLCNLFWKPEAYENWKFYNNRPKKPQEEQYVMNDIEYQEARKKVKKILSI